MKAFISFLPLTGAVAFAQTPRVDTLVSPQVQADRRVTFRVRAPKASEVSLFGRTCTLELQPGGNCCDRQDSPFEIA